MIFVLAIAAASIAAIVARPRGLPEWVSACAGALIIVAAHLLPGREALRAVASGWDVYLFLAGMLAISELLRVRGIFEWAASAITAAFATGGLRLFTAVFLCGVAVTALLSNDGTILLLTPAAVLTARRAGAAPLPLVFAVAMVSNAASFLLPISNPANLLLFPKLPLLHEWVAAFGLASLTAIALTWLALAVIFQSSLREPVRARPPAEALPRGGVFTAAASCAGIALVVAAAALGYDVGIAAAAAAAAVLLFTLAHDAGSVRRVVRGGPWSVIPLVAGLFVIVHALDRTRVLAASRTFLLHASAMNAWAGKLALGAAVAFAANVLNNLPAGVMTRYALQTHGIAPHVAHAALVGIDLGPNASLGGSLATLLWIMLLRREGIHVSGLQFLRVGLVATVPALALALLAVR